MQIKRRQPKKLTPIKIKIFEESLGIHTIEEIIVRFTTA